MSTIESKRVREWQKRNPEKVRKSKEKWIKENPEKVKYMSHKQSARSRGISFLLTFNEWLIIWGDKLENRGPRALQYCMARFGDKGEYKVGNVYITTTWENSSDAWWNKREKDLRLWGEAEKGGYPK